MKNSYYIKIADKIISFESAGISRAKITKKSLASDEFSFDVNLENACLDLLNSNSFKVLKNGDAIFEGSICSSAKNANALSQSKSFIAKNPWLHLEQIVYQQIWKSSLGVNNFGDVHKSKIIFGQDRNGVKTNIDAQILDILEHAISCGAELRVGEISLNTPMLFDEVRDLSCAEALRRCLNWAPDAIAYFTYETNKLPSLNIKKRSDLNIEHLDILQDEIISCKISPRDDLIIPCVCIKYEKTHSDDSGEWHTVEEDIYPPNANPFSRRTLVMTVDLEGEKVASQKSKIESEFIKITDKNWWLEKFPAYKSEDITDFVLKNSKRAGNLAYELKKGGVYDWMGASLEYDNATAIFTYTRKGKKMEKKVSLNILATNLSSGTYSTSFQEATEESTPVGLAKAIYEACENLQYEGEIILPPNSNSVLDIAKRISIANVPQQNAPIIACVTSSVEDLTTEIKTLFLGPPKYLYPTDITELFRINRSRKVPKSASAKVNARKLNLIDLSSSSSSGINTFIYEDDFDSLQIGDSEGEKPIIDLDPALMKPNCLMQPREILICHNGRPAKCFVLMTEPNENFYDD